MNLLDIDISAQESGYAEDLPTDMDPRMYCQETARHKTNQVFDASMVFQSNVDLLATYSATSNHDAHHSEIHANETENLGEHCRSSGR